MAKTQQSYKNDLLFVSWTNRDGLGKELGEAFTDFFDLFELGIDVFYSDRDLGNNWYNVLNENLCRAKFGVFCITPKAVNSEWVNYELGSILNNNEQVVCDKIKQRVFPIQLSNTDRINREKTPFSHNNVKPFCADELKEQIDSILKEFIVKNNLKATEALEKQKKVDKIFKLAFRDLKEKVDVILAKEKPEVVKTDGSAEVKKQIEELKAKLSDKQSEIEKLSILKSENDVLKSEILELRNQIRVIQTPQKPIYTSSSDPHPAIDLGLSVLWADRNIGSDNPWDYGDYFAWGETKPKPRFDWDNYKYANGDYNKLTKYCNKKEYGNNGFTDRNQILLPEDDAATANWHGEWRMPTIEEFEELRTNCKWDWTKNYNGKKGYIVSGNGNQIFLPAAGWRSDTLDGSGSYGVFWSSSLGLDYPTNARDLGFLSGDVGTGNYYRCDGLSVRAVRRKY